MRLGYVCTNYGNAAYTEQAVRTLHAMHGAHEVHCVIVNNGPDADDLARLQALAAAFPGVEVVTGQGNVGYFPGLNIGIERLRATVPDVELIVAGNNDLEFPPDFAESLERHRAVFDEWAVVSPDLVTPGGVHQNPLVREPITRTRHLVWALYYTSFTLARAIAWGASRTHRITARPERVHGDVLSREPGPVIQGYGACYILGPRFFGHFRRFYAPTFLMQEEFFLGEQLATVGQQVYYDPRFVVRHRDHATFDLLPTRRVWDVSRDAYRAMMAHRALPAARRAELIRQATTGADGGTQHKGR